MASFGSSNARFLHGDFVGIGDGHGRFRDDAAELLVIDQLGNGGVLAAQRALGIAAQAEFAEFHFEGVEEQQPANEGTAFAEGEL
jgi:hypothetical protein